MWLVSVSELVNATSFVDFCLQFSTAQQPGEGTECTNQNKNEFEYANSAEIKAIQTVCVFSSVREFLQIEVASRNIQFKLTDVSLENTISSVAYSRIQHSWWVTIEHSIERAQHFWCERTKQQRWKKCFIYVHFISIARVVVVSASV